MIQKSREKSIDEIVTIVWDKDHQNHSIEEINDAWQVYNSYLGKTEERFEKNFRSVPEVMIALPKIKDYYSEFLNSDRLSSVLNYVIKSRSKDQVRMMLPEEFNRSLIASVLNKLDGNASKKETTNIITTANNYDSFFKRIGIDDKMLISNITSLKENSKYHDVIEAIQTSMAPLYNEVIGNLKIPKGREKEFRDLVIFYHSHKDNALLTKFLKDIAVTTIKEGSEAAFEKVRNYEKNVQARKFYESLGINMNAFEYGMKRKYEVSIDKKIIEKTNDEIERRYTSIKQKLTEMKIPSSKHFDKIILNDLERIINGIETNDKKKLKEDLLAIKSHVGKLKNQTIEVEMYICTDPVHSIQMGEEFKTCFSITKPYQYIDRSTQSAAYSLNPAAQVIFAKKDGKDVAKVPIIMTDKGMLVMPQYKNEDYDFNDGFFSYLLEISQRTHSSLIFPKKFLNKNKGMKEIVQRTADKESYSSFNIIHGFLPIEYINQKYNDSYPDELEVSVGNGVTRVKGNVYIISLKK